LCLNKLNLNKNKVAFIILNDPMTFPPTINAAEILSKNGFQIDIFSLRNIYETKITVPPNVNIYYFGILKGGLYYRIKFFTMIVNVLYQSLKNKYKWIFAYNMTSTLPAYLAAKLVGSKLLYHNHDDTIIKNKFSFYGFLKMVEVYVARKANIVSYPQKQRADFFFKHAKLLNKPLIVKNGPLKTWTTKYKKSKSKYDYLKKKYRKILLYQGGLNWKRGIENILKIMRHMEDDVGLLLIGKIYNDKYFQNEFEKLIIKYKIKKKVVLFPPVSYNEIPFITEICDIGFGVMADKSDNDSFNIEYLAGASNKLVEYMAFGKPCIVPKNKTYLEYIVKNDLGICIDVKDPQESAKRITSLLNDNNQYQKISDECLKYFGSEGCFEAQFNKILYEVIK
jgi:glycosyltransferase involved in cell wall biosynthesis